ncbi:unnamed protein product [Anisakis simplex]|uniref:BTB_2 domain-containing protein n=1 Tax=Anisakis simplex TaxID=6269 RepID=A0A0M3K487_ANISI|nr:unnamed protein product [Anisakis simplex]
MSTGFGGGYPGAGGGPAGMMAVGSPTMTPFIDPNEFAPELHHSNEIVRINVSGKRYMTLYDTLVNGKSRFFEHMLSIDQSSGKIVVFRRNIIEDEDGQIFINRDGKLFAYILQYMRDGNRTVLPESTFLIRQLIVRSSLHRFRFVVRDRIFQFSASSVTISYKREAEFFAMDRYKVLLLQKLAEQEKSRDAQDDVADADVSNKSQSKQLPQKKLSESNNPKRK